MAKYYLFTGREYITLNSAIGTEVGDTITVDFTWHNLYPEEEGLQWLFSYWSGAHIIKDADGVSYPNNCFLGYIRTTQDDVFAVEHQSRHTVTFNVIENGLVDAIALGADGGLNFTGIIHSVTINTANNGSRIYNIDDGWENNPVIADSSGSDSHATAYNFSATNWINDGEERTSVTANSHAVIMAPTEPRSFGVKTIASSIAVILKPLPPIQRKGNITIIQTEDIFRDPNLYDMAMYADRGMQSEEVFWQHTLPVNVMVHAGAPFSTGILGSPTIDPIQIDVSVRGDVVGSFYWKGGQTEATVTWANSVLIPKGDEVILTVVQADVTVTAISINLLGAYT
ncbi:hypothetical protein NVP1188A_34 [Vibrio phage 1.188.A._10N.286.51.A6]|uniref:Uncharacterized protein n=3 Tax=Mukerjeevirus mv51A6 TaxID=2734162 RepID=A0A2I7RIY4_9CAUD|nr:hypothetical protein HOU77_gp72 [Vibrio phage 1.188.A._10N.286.51.A6]AUR93602.1 hypothetical protein NVP1188A_34 [Vibrio phage 1.188.A._10N.286.51.A6]AUR93688.1 hypothetical protein NVP1188B_34 [Vibrio phage 1.188.B._10N.286.51.A6]AUR93774.1 hypothetical protein NVP1188C_34 [Vibrio phage 1.188.C._10N.286.51.A6]